MKTCFAYFHSFSCYTVLCPGFHVLSIPPRSSVVCVCVFFVCVTGLFTFQRPTYETVYSYRHKYIVNHIYPFLLVRPSTTSNSNYTIYMYMYTIQSSPLQYYTIINNIYIWGYHYKSYWKWTMVQRPFLWAGSGAVCGFFDERYFFFFLGVGKWWRDGGARDWRESMVTTTLLW